MDIDVDSIIDGNVGYEEVKEIIIKASSSYHNEGISLISDLEYDTISDYFKKKYPEDKLNFKIGAPLKVSEWKKHKHKISMSSLNKINVVDEWFKWVDSIKGESFLVEDKLDGISINCEYLNGKLVDAITRGDDGILGESILPNVIKMKNVPKTIENFNGCIRGEIVMMIDDFNKVNEILDSKGEDQLSNPRNACTGIAKRYDGENAEYLTILFYDVEFFDGNTFENEIEKMEWLKKYAKVCFYKLCDKDEVYSIYKEYEESIRESLPYMIDGLVIKLSSISYQNKLGLLGEKPKGQIAWKFASMKKETNAEDVEWCNGKNRRITPVGEVKEVEIGGVKITHASLHNLSMFKKLNLGKGDRVIIARRNDVIPYLEEIVEHIGEKFEVPTHCPICNTPTEIEGKFLICPNDNCQALTEGNILKWINANEIMDVSEKTITLLHEAGLLNDPSDLYKLKHEDVVKLERMGNRSVTKLLAAIESKREIALEVFIEGLNISNFSNSRAVLLIDAGYDTIEKMQNVTVDELVKIKGIEIKTANAIINGLKAKQNVIKGLLEVVKIIIKEKVVPTMANSNGVFNGKSFVFTGAINKVDDEGNRYTRKMMEQLVIDNGGENWASVKAGLTYLVQADPSSSSSKTIKSIKLGIEILSEAKFFEILGL